MKEYPIRTCSICGQKRRIIQDGYLHRWWIKVFVHVHLFKYNNVRYFSLYCFGTNTNGIEYSLIGKEGHINICRSCVMIISNQASNNPFIDKLKRSTSKFLNSAGYIDIESVDGWVKILEDDESIENIDRFEIKRELTDDETSLFKTIIMDRMLKNEIRKAKNDTK